jgi:hypothetical protein
MAAGYNPPSMAFNHLGEDLPPSDSLLLVDRSAQAVIPASSGDQVHIKLTVEKTWMMVLRTIFYVVGIITCLVVLFVIWDAYQVLSDIQDAVKAWVDGITTPGVLGN